jgi:hypothetical protein
MNLLTFIQISRYKKELLNKLSLKPIKVSLQELHSTPVLKGAIEGLQKDKKITVTHDILSCYIYVSKC